MNDKEFLKDKKVAGGNNSSMDIRRIFNSIWHIKYWIMLCVAVALVCAYFYIRYTTPLYQKNISVVLNNQQNQYSDNFQLISNTLGSGSSTQIDNQIFLLRSTRLMQRVVERADLNIRYFSIGRFIEAEEYTSAPLIFTFIPDEGYENVYLNILISFTQSDKIHIDSFNINGISVKLESDYIIIDEVVETPVGSFILAARGEVDIKRLSSQLRITRSSQAHTAKVLAGRLLINSNPRQANVVTISIKDQHPKRAESILNILMVEYNILSKDYDSQGIQNTIAFLDERIAGLEMELEDVEGKYTSYRTSNELIDAKSQASMAMNSEAGYRDRLNQVALQVSLLDIVKGSLAKSTYEMIPGNIGISDGPLNASINQYNQLVIDRDRMLASSSENNPMVQNATALLSSLKDNIIQSVRNLETAYALQQKSLSQQLGSSQREMAAMPYKQLALTRISRSQQVKEPLYILLQQKREEALLTLSSLSDHAYVVDAAYGSNLPISPKENQIYILAVMIALLLPIGFVLAINITRSKILFEKDIIDRCDIPVLGIVPKATLNKKSPMKAVSVTETGRDPLTESFRMLRSKLQYLNIAKTKPGGFIIQVTSSGPAEGKSFMSINMALSLAYLGKKVLLVGADLRKPTLSKYLEMERYSRGLSDYLAGNIKDVHQIITTYKDSALLDIIPAGPIPFNPSELLSTTLLGDTLDMLRSEYDYIIVDSAPFLVVSDSFMLSKSTDSVLYVVRAGYTKLSILDTLQNMYLEGSFNSIMIVLNSVDFKKNALYGAGKMGNGYGYGYSYGYGYGHGANYGYVSDDTKKKSKKSKKNQ